MVRTKIIIINNYYNIYNSIYDLSKVELKNIV